MTEQTNITRAGGKFWQKERVMCWWRYRPSSEVVEMTAYVVMTDVLLMLLDTQRISQNTVMALQVLSLYSQSVARLEQNLNLTNPPLLRQDWINSDLPVS